VLDWFRTRIWRIYFILYLFVGDVKVLAFNRSSEQWSNRILPINLCSQPIATAGGRALCYGSHKVHGSFVHNMHSGRPTSWVYFTSTPEYGMNLRETRSISFVFSCQCALGVGCPVVSEQNTRRAAFCLRFDLHLKRKMFGKFSFLLYFGQDRSQFVPASVIYHSGIK